MWNRFKGIGEGALYPRIGIVAAILLLIGCMTLIESAPIEAGNDTLECDERIAVAAVHCTATGLGEILKDLKGEKERIELIRGFIDQIRFYADQSGYFYVYDFDCVNIAHATQKDLLGKDLSGHRDTRGKLVIRELSAVAQKGGGFVEYYWVKPDSKDEHRKMGYVEPIPNTTYFIGTGVYLKEE